ncbi:histidinol-phosphate transaminase [Luminiphilus sp.]|nr:histidinol-phosphate transaminase [Luminiphilus sp.]|tara:strand:- start:4093 stop:5160 length:1068 start_codon:yes stop_codon:yes gene_type:complete
MSRFWTTTVSDLTPYVPGEQPASQSLLKLNTNEHALPPSEAVMTAIRACQAEQLRRYPDPAAQGLREAIAQTESLTTDQVFVGNGSDEVLAHVWFSLLADRPVQTLDTTYGFYPVWAQLYHSTLTEVPVRADFSVDVDALMASEHAVVLANPNAPTGLALTRQEIERLLAGNPNRLHIIDEAYYGFGADTVAPLINQYDNLIVSRSLSKSHALAGLRVGYALAHQDLIEGLNRVKDSFNSYPLDAVAQAAAKVAICDASWQAQSVAVVTESRSKMTEGLETLGFEVLPSSANFIFIQHRALSGRTVFDGLRQQDILVRRWDKPRVENWLRITVGTLAQTNALLEACAALCAAEEA